MEVLRRSAAVLSHGESHNDNHPSSPHRSKPESPLVSVTAAIRRRSGQHHSDSDDEGCSFPIDLSSGGGSSHRSSSADEGPAGHQSPPSGQDGNNFGRNGGLLDLTLSRSPSAGDFHSKESPREVSSLSPTSSNEGGNTSHKRARLEEMVSHIRRTTTNIWSPASVPGCPRQTQPNSEDESDFRPRSYSDSEMHRPGTSNKPARQERIFSRSDLLLKTCSLQRSEEARDVENEEKLPRLHDIRLPELISIKDSYGRIGGSLPDFTIERSPKSSSSGIKRRMEEDSTPPPQPHGADPPIRTPPLAENPAATLQNLFGPAQLAQQALLERLGAQLAAAGSPHQQAPPQDLPGGGALLERILQLNISAAALQQQGVVPTPGLFPDVKSAPLGAMPPPTGAYPPFLYYSYYAQMLHAAQSAWQTQQAVLRAGQQQESDQAKNYGQKVGGQRNELNATSPTASPRKDRSFETNGSKFLNTPSPSKFLPGFPAALLAAAAQGRRLDLEDPASGLTSFNSPSPSSKVAFPSQKSRNQEIKRKTRRNDDDDSDDEDDGLGDEEDDDLENDSYFSPSTSWGGDGAVPPGLVVRKRAPRALTGKHVRQGTGASPTVLLSLREKIQERLKIREQLGIIVPGSVKNGKYIGGAVTVAGLNLMKQKPNNKQNKKRSR